MHWADPMSNPLIIFDFDGTLVNSEPGILKAIQLTVAELGLPEACVEQWRQMIGLPLQVQLTALLPEDRQAEVNHGVETYRQFYKEVGWSLCDPFPGIPALIEQLADDAQLAIASSKQRKSIRRILDPLPWGHHFTPIMTPTEVSAPKPDPESIHRILDHHQGHPDKTVMIGDTQYDVEMATRAGILGLGVSWGVHPHERLATAGAHHVFETPAALQAFLNDWIFE